MLLVDVRRMWPLRVGLCVLLSMKVSNSCLSTLLLEIVTRHMKPRMARMLVDHWELLLRLVFGEIGDEIESLRWEGRNAGERANERPIAVEMNTRRRQKP